MIGDISKWVGGIGILIAGYLVLSKADAFNTITQGAAQGASSLISTLQGR